MLELDDFTLFGDLKVTFLRILTDDFPQPLPLPTGLKHETNWKGGAVDNWSTVSWELASGPPSQHRIIRKHSYFNMNLIMISSKDYGSLFSFHT